MTATERDSVKRSVSERIRDLGPGLTRSSSSALLVAIAGATLWPVVAPLLGTGVAIGVAGGLAGLISGSGQAWLNDFLARHAARRGPGDARLDEAAARAAFEGELVTRLQADDAAAAALRADVSAVLQAVGGVEAALTAVSDELHETLVQAFAELAAAREEFAWVLRAVEAPLSDIQQRQVETLAVQRRQLELQREQLVKTNLLLHVGARAPPRPARAAAEPGRPPPADVECPYKGLASFEAEDADIFFGREALVAELLARHAEASFLAVVGASGSGKSSLIRAGMVSALWKGALPGSEQWPIMSLVPGARPLEELAAHVALRSGVAGGSVLDDLRSDPTRAAMALRQVLAQAPAGARCVLVVDQLEEVFTLCRDVAEREGFLRALASVGRRADARAAVVVALRADFFDRFAAIRELAARLQEHQLLVGAMSAAELRSAIERPAAHAGLRLQPGLVEAVLGDLGREPGALPLLSHALRETWRRREGVTLTVAGYAESGGVRGALAQTAESAFARFGPAEQDVARRVFMRLTVPGEGTEDTRCRVAMSDLIAHPRQADVTGRVVGELVHARLLTAGEAGVDVAHEALIRGWPRLRQWLDEDREGLHIHRRLTAAAQEWLRTGRDEGALYRGARLAEAVAWAEGSEPSLNALERAFLTASASRERAAQRARRRRVQTAIGGLSVALAAISVVALVAVRQGHEAARQRDIALAGQLALSSRDALATEPALGLALALRAVDVSETPAATTALRQATLESRALAVLRGHEGEVYGADLDAGGRRAVSAGRDGTVRVWDLGSGRLLAAHPLRHGAVFSARFSPDGRRIATATQDGAVIMLDAGGERRIVLRVPGANVYSVAFDVEGTRVVAALTDGTVRVVETIGDGGPVVFRGHSGIPYRAAFSPDGKAVVSGDDEGSVRVWEAATGVERLRLDGHRGVVTDARFSTDGQRVVTAGYDGRIRLWSAHSGAELDDLLGDDQELSSVELSHDGRRVLCAGEDGVVRIRDVADGRVVVALRGHRGGVFDATFGPAERVVVSAGFDGTARAWSVPDVRTMRAPVTNAAASADGRLTVTGGRDGAVRVWDPARRALLATLGGHSRPSWVDVSHDGRRVASASEDGTVRVWRMPDRRLEGVFEPHSGKVWDVAFAPTGGQRIATAGEDGRVVVRTLADDGTVVLTGGRGALHDVDFSPTGAHVAAAGADGAVRIWRSDRAGRPTTLSGHRRDVFGVEYSQDGTRLVSAGVDGTVRVWDLADRRSEVLRGHQGAVESASFGPHGARIVSAGLDGTVRVWDSRGGAALAVLHTHSGGANSASFASDGDRLLTAGKDGTVRLLDCEVCGSLGEVVRLARSRWTREPTQSELARLMPGAG